MQVVDGSPKLIHPVALLVLAFPSLVYGRDEQERLDSEGENYGELSLFPADLPLLLLLALVSLIPIPSLFQGPAREKAVEPAPDDKVEDDRERSQDDVELYG